MSYNDLANAVEKLSDTNQTLVDVVLQNQNVTKVATYAQLRAYRGTAKQIQVSGPGVAGLFNRRVRLPEDADDNGTIIVSTANPAFVYEREISGRIQFSWFNVQDGSLEDASIAGTSAAAVALKLGRALEILGNFRLRKQIDFRGINLIASASSFTLDDPTQFGLILGGNASQSYNPEQRVGRVYRADESMAVPTIRIMGAKGQRIYIGRTQYLQLFASTSAPDRNRNYSIAYSTFNLGHINLIELTNDQANAGGAANSDTGGTIQWINENQFYLNRCHGLIISGTYTHNHNKFIGGTWEGPVTIDMQTGFHNYVLGGRFEEGPTTIKFGANSANCWIQKTWDGVIDDRQSGLISGTVTDLGSCNVVSDDFSARHNISCVAFASINDPVVNFMVDTPARVPHLQRIGGTAGNAPVLMSDKIRINRNLEFYWVWEDFEPTDTVLYRPYMEFFDKNGMPINAQLSWVLTPGATTPSGNFLSTGTGVNASSGYWATITKAALDAGALYIRVGIRISSGQTANSLARTLAIYCSTPHNVKYQGNVETKRYAPIAVTAAPTQGFVPQGWSAFNVNNGEQYFCTFAFETTNTVAIAAGDMSLTVASVAGIAVNDRIGINFDDRDTFYGRVASIAGNVLTLATTITKASKVGSRIVINRQITK